MQMLRQQLEEKSRLIEAAAAATRSSSLRFGCNACCTQRSELREPHGGGQVSSREKGKQQLEVELAPGVFSIPNPMAHSTTEVSLDVGAATFEEAKSPGGHFSAASAATSAALKSQATVRDGQSSVPLNRLGLPMTVAGPGPTGGKEGENFYCGRARDGKVRCIVQLYIFPLADDICVGGDHRV